MSDQILYKGTFVVDTQLPNEPVNKYLERVLFKFEEHISNRVPVMSQGHYQNFSLDEDGLSYIKVKPEHRITNVTIQPAAGAGAYVHEFKLTEDRAEDNKSGDKVIIYIAAPTSVNPTIKILDQDGVTISNKTFNGSGNDSVILTIIKLNDLWRV